MANLPINSATIAGANTSITSDMFNYSFKPDIETKLRQFADHGFQYLHWCDDWNNEVAYTRKDMTQYLQLVESAGLKCLDVHGTATGTVRIDSEDENSWRKYADLLINRIEFCSVLGGDTVVIHPPRPTGGTGLRRRLERSIRLIDDVRSLAEDLGVTIAVENCYASDEKILEAYFDRYPPEFIGFCFDSGHANIHGNLNQLKRFGDRLRVLHLHDNNGVEDAHQPPFWGNTDWDEVMSWIRDSQYGKPINFEITHDTALFDGTMKEFLNYTVKSINRVMTL